MGIPTYTKTTLPFIASIVIGTIQLGATVDYAILMTNKYKRARYHGAEKKEAVIEAMQGSVQSIVVSALSFFAATFGVGLYSNIDMISSLCTLMARGALISMVVVILLLPTMFMSSIRSSFIQAQASETKKNRSNSNQVGKHFERRIRYEAFK